MEQNHFCISSFFTITKKRNCITPNRALSSPPSLGSAAWDPLIPESGKPLHRNKASLSSLLFQHDIIQVGGWILLWMLVCYETAQLYIYIYILPLFCSNQSQKHEMMWGKSRNTALIVLVQRLQTTAPTKDSVTWCFMRETMQNSSALSSHFEVGVQNHEILAEFGTQNIETHSSKTK